MLWLVNSKYPEFGKDSSRKGLSIALWAQYVLDNFATVAEVVAEFEKEEFVVVTDYIPGTQKFTTIHLSVSDSSGDSAILEYIDGKIVINHERWIIRRNVNCQGIPGNIFLPGTNRAADRFVRASYYIDAIPQTDDVRIATASVFSVVRNCSVPYGISTEGFPNLSTTRWRIVADQKNLIYYFEDALSPNTVWVELNKIDFSETSKVKKLALDKQQIYAGESSDKFVESAPFKFQGIDE